MIVASTCDIILISFLSSTWSQICWCMIKTALDVLQRPATIFGDLRKYLENVHKRSSGLRTGFGESSENHQKRCYAL